jgi:4-oxalocrotonate tautomerase
VPHVHIKHFPRDFTDEQKQRLADAITAVVTDHFDTYDGAVSIALEPVTADDWDRAVLVPDIQGRAGLLIKKPDYRSS